MLWNFDMELMPDSEAWNEQKILSFWDKGPLNVRLKRVNGAGVGKIHKGRMTVLDYNLLPFIV